MTVGYGITNRWELTRATVQSVFVFSVSSLMGNVHIVLLWRGQMSYQSILYDSGHLSYHHRQSLSCQGRWGTTDDFATSFLHFPLFSTALWDFLNSRPGVCPIGTPMDVHPWNPLKSQAAFLFTKVIRYTLKPLHMKTASLTLIHDWLTECHSKHAFSQFFII